MNYLCLWRDLRMSLTRLYGLDITGDHVDRVRSLSRPSEKLIYFFLVKSEPQSFTTIRRSLRLSSRTVVRLNGSQILAESPIPETIRGHTTKAVYLMEANFIRDDEDLYTAVPFTLNTTDGYLIAESTPWNTDSVFYKMFHDPAYNNFQTFTVDYTRAMPPYGPLSTQIVEMIKAQLAGDPSRWKREMLCMWTEDPNTWLPTSLITLAQDSEFDLIPRIEDEPLQGNLYVGVDFGKHRDHSVVAVLEALEEHIYLRHMKRFPLETPYGAVIGYLKKYRTLGEPSEPSTPTRQA